MHLPNVPAAVNQGTEYVTLPGDTPVISKAQAEKTATQWAGHWIGPATFNSIILAHAQNITRTGKPVGAPGSLQWIFTIIGPKSFSAGFGGSFAGETAAQQAAALAAYPYPAQYAIICIDATTGKEDAMTLT